MIKLHQRAGTVSGDFAKSRPPSSTHEAVSKTGYDLLQESGRKLSAIEALIQARRDLEMELSIIEQEIAADPMSADTEVFSDHYEKAVNRIRDELVKTIADVSEQDVFVSRFGAHAENRIDALTAGLAETLKERAIERLNTLLAGIADALSREEDGDEMDRLVRDGLSAIEAFSEILPIENLQQFEKNVSQQAGGG